MSVPEWLGYIKEVRALSPNTVRGYARSLSTLANAETATKEEVEAWWRTRTHLAVTSRVVDLAAVRSYYKWMLRFGHRNDDPTLRIDAPRLPRGLPRPVSRADFQRLLAATDGDSRRAIAIGAYTGMRVSEAAVLDWADIDTEMRRVRISGKGQKTRLVGLSPLLLDAIGPPVRGNVVAAGGHPYTADTLQRKVNRAIRAAGVDATYHQLRHRFGTVALAATGNLLAVSRAMGHSSPTTTAIYAATSDADLDVIAEAVAR